MAYRSNVIGYSTAAPNNGLLVSGQVGIGTSTTTSGTSLDIQTTQDTPTICSTTAYGTNAAPTFLGRRASGSQSSPTATDSGVSLSTYSGLGRDNAGAWTSEVGRMQFISSQAFTTTAQGTECRISTTSNGTTTLTERVRISNGGGVYIGAGTNAVNRLDVPAGVAIGTYAGVNTAPTNGLIVSGQTGLGTATPNASAFSVINVPTSTTWVNVHRLTGTLQGTEGIVGASGDQAVLRLGITHQPNGTATRCIGYYVNATLDASSATGTTISNYYGIFVNESILSSGTVTSSYGAFIRVPSFGTNRQALYSDNHSVGFSAVSPPSNGAIISGNVSIGASSNTYKLQVTGGEIAAMTLGNGFRVAEGSNARMGTATLNGGATATVTVNTTAVTANSRIFITGQTLGTITSAAAYSVSARTAGTSFTITSSTTLDTSIVAWIIFEPS